MQQKIIATLPAPTYEDWLTEILENLPCEFGLTMKDKRDYAKSIQAMFDRWYMVGDTPEIVVATLLLELIM